MRYKYIFFDLDGTLTDPQEGITNCVQYSLESFGIQETDYSKLMRFIGPPLIYSFQEYYGFSEEKARAAVAKYRERFADIGIFDEIVFEQGSGIIDISRFGMQNGVGQGGVFGLGNEDVSHRRNEREEQRVSPGGNPFDKIDVKNYIFIVIGFGGLLQKCEQLGAVGDVDIALID